MGPQTFCANFCTPKNFPTLTFCHYLNMFYKKKFFTLTNLCQCIYPHKNFPKLPFCHYLNKFFYRFLLSIFSFRWHVFEKNFIFKFAILFSQCFLQFYWSQIAPKRYSGDKNHILGKFLKMSLPDQQYWYIFHKHNFKNSFFGNW